MSVNQESCILRPRLPGLTGQCTLLFLLAHCSLQPPSSRWICVSSSHQGNTSRVTGVPSGLRQRRTDRYCCVVLLPSPDSQVQRIQERVPVP